MNVLKIIFLLLILVVASTSDATAAGGTTCNCAAGTCWSNGMTWPISKCPECTCPGGSTGIGSQPYSQPVDSTFLKNNFNFNWNELMQFMKDYYAPISPAVLAGILVDSMQPLGQQEWRQEDYERFDEIMRGIEEQALKDDLAKANDLTYAALTKKTPEEVEMENKAAERFFAKMKAIAEMFPALDHVDPDTLNKLLEDAKREVREEAEKNKTNP
jgi:hypothetical protein